MLTIMLTVLRKFNSIHIFTQYQTNYGIFYPRIDVDCSPDAYFRCHNDACLPNEVKCDGHDDCGDGSDEQSCGERRLLNTMRRCRSILKRDTAPEINNTVTII